MKFILRHQRLMLLALSLVLPLAARAESDYQIASVKAYLFYNHTGGFSENVIDNPHFIFWNAIIGEGSAKEPSDAVFVDVEVEGSPGSYEQRSVELLAADSGGAILKRSVETGVFSTEGRFHAGFWLYSTGCTPVKLTVRILGQDQEVKVVKDIPFACGE